MRKVLFKGSPLTLIGRKLTQGESVLNFKALNQDLSPAYLSDFGEKIKIITSFPSIDTPVCDLQVKEFNKRAASLSENVVIIGISKDLPFAQSRFCKEKNIEKVVTLSDHKDADFGKKFGVLIKDIRLLARAVFIVDAYDVVQYEEYVPEVTSHPNYERALEIVKSLA